MPPSAAWWVPRSVGPIAWRWWFDRRVRAAARMADWISPFDQPDDDHRISAIETTDRGTYHGAGCEEEKVPDLAFKAGIL